MTSTRARGRFHLSGLRLIAARAAFWNMPSPPTAMRNHECDSRPVTVIKRVIHSTH